jgi:hypothetical protein
MGGIDCSPVTAGPTPGMISGMLQVSATVPAGLSGQVPVVVTIRGVSSQAGVTLEVTPAANNFRKSTGSAVPRRNRAGAILIQLQVPADATAEDADRRWGARFVLGT